MSSQHQLTEFRCAKRGKHHRVQKIKRWKLKDATRISLKQMWEEMSKVIRKTGEELLGKTSAEGPPEEKKHVGEMMKCRKI